MIRAVFADAYNSLKARVDNGGGKEKSGLVVATRPLKIFENAIRFFVNSDAGIDMNVDAAAGGTPLKIYDGTDSVLWTASDIVGGVKTTFDSTDQNHTAAGTKSIRLDNAPVNDIFELAKGSDFDANGYVSLSMWIYVDKDWLAGDSIEVYAVDTATNTQIGDAIGLQNYFAYSSYGVWHHVAIPLADMGILATSTIADALWFTIVTSEGKSPKFYIDDIQLEETGTPRKFELKADSGTWLHVDSFTISIAAVMAGTLSDATMPNLAYDKILTVTPVVGLTYQREQASVIRFSQKVLNLYDFMSLPLTDIAGAGSDGTNTWITMRAKHTEPLIIKPENNDTLSFIINDDYSGLLKFRISAGCRIETR